jgi:hypothetical protein
MPISSSAPFRLHFILPDGAAVQVAASSARVGSAWFQLFKLKYDATARKFCFNFYFPRPAAAAVTSSDLTS